MNNFLNENWPLAMDAVGKRAIKALIGIGHEILRNVAKMIPYKELFCEWLRKIFVENHKLRPI